MPVLIMWSVYVPVNPETLIGLLTDPVLPVNVSVLRPPLVNANPVTFERPSLSVMVTVSHDAIPVTGDTRDTQARQAHGITPRAIDPPHAHTHMRREREREREKDKGKMGILGVPPNQAASKDT